MIDLDNHTNYEVKTSILEKITQTLTNKELELIVVNNEEIQKLNLQYRQKDSATDVLSFPIEQSAFMPLGSIVISIDYVNQKAKEYNHTKEDEFALLFIHGLLHLLGFDHETDNGEHRQKEEELIKTFNLPDSLIVRNS